jgi:hypothetical protein
LGEHAGLPRIGELPSPILDQVYLLPMREFSPIYLLESSEPARQTG